MYLVKVAYVVGRLYGITAIPILDKWKNSDDFRKQILAAWGVFLEEPETGWTVFCLENYSLQLQLLCFVGITLLSHQSSCKKMQYQVIGPN